MLGRTIDPLLALPRLRKRAIVLCIDISLCVIATWTAFYLRLGDWVYLSGRQWLALAASLAIALPIFITFGLYRAIFRYATRSSMLGVLRAVTLYGLIYSAIFTFIGIVGIPRTVGIIQPILLLLGVGASRLAAHYWLSGSYQRILSRNALPRALIYGAGRSGRELADAMAASSEMRAIGFLDDNVQLQGSNLCGLPIYNPVRLNEVALSGGVTHVLLAVPSATRKRRREILALVREAAVEVRTLPRLMDLAHGRVQVSDLRELEIEDLLGRAVIAPDPALLTHHISGRSVFVTGAGGSIGSELCRQILRHNPSTLLLLDHSEHALYEIERELRASAIGTSVKIVPLLLSVADEAAFNEALRRWKPHSIYHAAAYKHVTLIQDNVLAGVANNILGTLIAVTAAISAGVPNFVLVSTDKAVRPTNVMGACKRVAEMILQALQPLHPSSRLSMVRFGNVLGSSGSVVPIFRRQIKDGGPITVTHPDVTRYFMTIPEAAQLVIQAAAMADGGEVFVLDMGEPVRIVDLARSMVELSGLRVREEQNGPGDIEIQIVGLKPGEKLHEELLIGNNPTLTAHSRIMKAHEDFMGWERLSLYMQKLQSAVAKRDKSVAIKILTTLVEGFQPSPSLPKAKSHDVIDPQEGDLRHTAN